MKQNSIEIEEKRIFSFCEIFIRKDNVLQINILPKADITSYEVKIMVEESLSIAGKPYPVIIFVGEFANFSKDAKEYSASPKGKLACTGEAYVVNNLGHSIVGNIYLKINQPVKPVAFFYTEEKALGWLKQKGLMIE